MSRCDRCKGCRDMWDMRPCPHCEYPSVPVKTFGYEDAKKWFTPHQIACYALSDVLCFYLQENQTTLEWKIKNLSFVSQAFEVLADCFKQTENFCINAWTFNQLEKRGYL